MNIPLVKSLICSGILASVSVVWAPAAVCAADMEFKPFLTVSEEFTDNVYELAGIKRHELITRLQPGTTFRYKAPLWNWDIAYNFDYRSYARTSKRDESTHNAALKGNLFLLDNFLYLDVSDTYQRVTLDVSRNTATESSLFLNQTDQNIAIVSPWLLWRPTAKSTLKTGYRYTDTRYLGDGIEKQEQRGYADFNNEITSKLSLTAGYAFARLVSIPTRHSKHDLSAGFRYEYTDKSFLFGSVGNSWQQFDPGRSVNYLFWNAGLTYDAGGTVATLETSVQNTEDPLAVSTRETSYKVRLDKTLQRGTLGVAASYSEYVNTQTNAMDHTRLSLGGTLRYEVLQSLTANLGLSAERFSSTAATDLPYRFIGNCGLSYALKNELTFGLTYSHVTELLDLDTTDGTKEINRVILEVKKGLLAMINALTIDVEDYFQVNAFARTIRQDQWDSYPLRVDGNTRHILDMLDSFNVKATFFILGWVAERLPELVREIHKRGHEVACHGFDHQLIYAIGPERFRADIRRSKALLEDQCGVRVNGYRAPSYSITKQSLWALDILIEEGFKYDSSIFPVLHDTYGIPNAERFPYTIQTGAGPLVEFPLTTLQFQLAWKKMRLPIAGGGYLRLLPVSIIQHGITSINQRERQPAVLYFHPWEIDPNQPRIKAGMRSRFRHYLNLSHTERKLQHLFSTIKFAPMQDVLSKLGYGYA